jgi:recombination protein RecR
MDPIHKLSELFSRFPGIGTRQSRRFVYFLLKQNRAYVKELVGLIESLENNISECNRCHRYFMKKHEKGSRCNICTSQNRDGAELLVVERDADLEAVEKSGTYNGLYFVLGGTLPMLEKKPETTIRAHELLRLVSDESGNIREIILACAMTPEGEHTAEYVRDALMPLAEQFGFRLTTLGRGLSTGTELEYSDSETLRYALEGRR